MDIINFLFFNIIPFLIVLTILVFVHELGHYLVALKNGVKVNVFSIGFGPEIFGWTNKKGMRWKFSAIPLGGYVKLDQEDEVFKDNNSSFKSNPDSGSLLSKSVWQRMAISGAGPVANYSFAILMLSILYCTVGQKIMQPGILIGHVTTNSVGANAGLVSGDEIFSINGQSADNPEQLIKITQNSLTQPLTLEIKKLNQQGLKTIVITPKVINGKGRLGLELHQPYVIKRHTFFDGTFNAIKDTFKISAITLKQLGQMLIGKRSTDGLTGPIGIATKTGEVAQKSLTDLLFLAAFLSINLGLINLFPIPILDGGHLLLYSLEAIRGKPVPEKLQEYAFRIGFAIIAVLFVFTFWNDLNNTNVFQWLLSKFKQIS